MSNQLQPNLENNQNLEVSVKNQQDRNRNDAGSILKKILREDAQNVIEIKKK